MDNSSAKINKKQVHQAHWHYYFSMKGFFMHLKKNASILNQAKMN